MARRVNSRGSRISNRARFQMAAANARQGATNNAGARGAAAARRAANPGEVDGPGVSAITRASGGVRPNQGGRTK